MPTLIDIFSGAGGLTLGFKLAFTDALEIVWANDLDKDALGTYKQNFGDHGIVGDLSKLLEDSEIEIPHADIVRGFSVIGSLRSSIFRWEKRD